MTHLLETERLIIRNWIPQQDAEQVFAIYNDPEVIYFLGSAARPPSIEVQRQHLIDSLEESEQLKNGTGSWAIVEKDTKKIAGTIMLSQLPDKNRIPTQEIEVGWHLKRSDWGKGYATEAGRAILEYGFNQLHLPVIYAVVKPGHLASIHVTERLQMKPLGLTSNYYGIELLLFQQTPPDKIKGIGDR
ncbi:GNAT family N-acetyltransferase [Anabaena sphaerica FACHB-251]|uniref:GNAT family N-acetyltransferase n=1 Tax=Anabaena sphaerica FACHB-251 TaxID=2692883 RepID=A0A926WD77_9NOST|nr:GNAT family N-acetyltransferase [Anabaena sphaerica]MBD2292410.1 GNAT family N-acetyltransferase [Anabaena sphaerica FACHB-251]